jgi:two-component system heavy metal sensor histidine kinase CusS
VNAPHRSWSLRRRVALVSACLSTLPAAVATIVGVTWLSQSVDAELATLVREELEEAHVSLASSEVPARDLAVVAPHLSRSHPQVRMAFRLVDLVDGNAIAEHGDRDLVARLPTASTNPTAQFVEDPAVRRPEDGLFVADLRLRDDLGLTLLLDGAERRLRIDRYWTIGLATSALALLLGVVAANVLSRRLRTMLAQVTQDLGTGGEAPGPARLPDELVPMRERLWNMLEDVRRRADQTKVFTAGLAHELRSPLQNLIGEAEVALLRERDRDTYRALLERQLQEHHEFARAVDNLLHVCAAHEPERRSHRERFSMTEECQLRLQAERQLASTRGVRLQFETDGSTDMIGDREALARVIRNLVNNAIRWSPDGGLVRVVLAGDERDLRIEVHDEGPGVPIAERERIFVPFETSTSPIGSRAGFGFGLGLAITRMAVDDHGGSIQVLDSPQGGARFVVVLPRKAGDADG